MTSKKPWHPLHDGLSELTASLREFADVPPAELADRVAWGATAPTYALANAWARKVDRRNFPMSGVREIVVHWLRTSYQESEAGQLDQRFAAFMQRARDWENRARQSLEWRASDCREREREGRPVEAVDRLGESVIEAYNELLDEAESLIEYVERLRLMLAPPPLADRAKRYLLAMAKLGAWDSSCRKGHTPIVRQAWGRSADPNNYRRIPGELKDIGLIDSVGRGSAGYWLTLKGQRLADQLQPARH